ncbi:MAG: nucleotidyltransferase domain-containing protein [Chloroflexi bacterium]|nr:nucleotidyltransferase domain-containing protein [Chloroflexota bacterium]
MMKANEQAALTKLKKEIEKTHRLVDYRLFGSKARGDDSAESDIDVMIEVEDYTKDVEALIDDAVFEINLEYECQISVLIFGSSELREGPLRESPIYRSISVEGVSM